MAIAQLNCHPDYSTRLKKHTAADTLRAHLLIDLVMNRDRIPPDSVIPINKELLQISEANHYQRGIGIATILMARALIVENELAAALKLIQKADSLRQFVKDPFLNFQVLTMQATYFADFDLLKSIYFGEQAVKIAYELNNSKYIYSSHALVSMSYVNNGKYISAFQHAEKSLEYAKKLNSYNSEFNAAGQLATIYNLMGKQDKAMETFSGVYNQNNWDEVNSESKANFFNNFGELYRAKKEYHKALELYFAAKKETKNVYSQAIFISNIANCYDRLDSLELAKQYAFKSLSLARSIGLESLYPWIYYSIASVHNKEGRIDSAIYYSKNGLQIANTTHVLEDLRNLNQEIAKAFVKKGNFEQAYKYYEQYIVYRDTMATSEALMKYALVNHEHELNLKQTQIDSLFSQKKTQNWLLWSIAAVLVLIITIALLLLRNNKQKQKAYELLNIQKQEINQKAKELALQKENLQRSYENVQLLGEIGRKITSSLSVNNIISTVYENVNKLMDASMLGIGLYDAETKTLQFPCTFENGQPLPLYKYDVSDPNRLSAYSFNNEKELLINDFEKEYQQYVPQLPKPIAGQQPHSLIYLPLRAHDETVGVLTVQSFHEHAYNEYHVSMLRTIALYTSIALENAESYKRLNDTVDNLKSTQKQLIQSEKMASLGELTAGIAHEIQNPLNFVTNFSDISRELTLELKEEIKAKNYSEVEAIADSLHDNQIKILHHSKRADSIVKGMLQHSRSSAGQKEKVHINALADEYLRLAYHGLRAKEKSFNATMHTNYDPHNPAISIVSQDIGRVLLNIITNAFHAMQEKRASTTEEYQPALSLKTRVENHTLKIEIEDNANGVPEHLREKIFQPFFTTKAAGQGTGLGLSLAYDIIKAHGGNIRLESKTGLGSKFIIELPV